MWRWVLVGVVMVALGACGDEQVETEPETTSIETCEFRDIAPLLSEAHGGDWECFLPDVEGESCSPCEDQQGSRTVRLEEVGVCEWVGFEPTGTPASEVCND